MREVFNIRMARILSDIVKEIERAKQQWGEDFDLKNTQNDWEHYIVKYVSKAGEMGATFEEVETNLRKAAGLIITAIDMHQRTGFAPRHYEGQTRPASLPEIQQ